MGAKDAFGHRQAVLARDGLDASDDAVVQSYLDDLAEGGALFAYLACAELAHRIDETLFVHGAIGPGSLGHVPGEGAHDDDVDRWIARLNCFYAEPIEAFAKPFDIAGTAVNRIREGRRMAADLHAGLYGVIYVPLTTGNAMDIYKSIAWELGLPTECNRAALYRQIREELSRVCAEARVRPILIVDEAHHLRSEVLEDLATRSHDLSQYAIRISDAPVVECHRRCLRGGVSSGQAPANSHGLSQQ